MGLGRNIVLAALWAALLVMPLGCKRYSDISGEAGPQPPASPPGPRPVPGRGWPWPWTPPGWAPRRGKPLTVLLGEGHPVACDHLAQARVIELMVEAGAPPVVGLEMVSLDMQPVLELFNKGIIGVDELESGLKWSQTWGYPFAIYRPIFEAAKETQPAAVRPQCPPRRGQEGRQIRPQEPCGGRTARASGEDHPRPPGAGGVSAPGVQLPPLRHPQGRQGRLEELRHGAGPVGHHHGPQGGGSARVPAPPGGGHRRGRDMWSTAGASPRAWPRSTRRGSACCSCPWRGADTPDKSAADIFFYCPEIKRPRLGIALEIKDSTITVASVEPGSKAEASGIKVGDVLAKAQGQELAHALGPPRRHHARP